MKTLVGVVPFNPNKVNQDRAMIIGPVFGRKDNGVFGVFDGHGVRGDDVSSFLTHSMTKSLSDASAPHSKLYLKFAKNPEQVWSQLCFFLLNVWLVLRATDNTQGLIELFKETTNLLKKSNQNCTFSGSTATCVYLDKQKIWCANVGDSRAVLGRWDGSSKKLTATLLNQEFAGA